MKKIIVTLMIAALFLGCSKDEEIKNVEPVLVVGKSLDINLKDQFEKPQTLTADTKKVVFAFSKDMAHICNDYFVTQTPTYLADNNTLFVADISAAPSIIRSLFILPGIEDFKHTVVLLDDKAQAAPFRAGLDTEQIIIVYVEDKSITKIQTITTEADLKKLIEQ